MANALTRSRGVRQTLLIAYKSCLKRWWQKRDIAFVEYAGGVYFSPGLIISRTRLNAVVIVGENPDVEVAIP